MTLSLTIDRAQPSSNHKSIQQESQRMDFQERRFWLRCQTINGHDIQD